jgi:polyphosphate glucokinase
VIDIGGTQVKLMVSGRKERRKFSSGPEMRPHQMVRQAVAMTGDWDYDVVAIGYPGPIVNGKPASEPVNLGAGWVGFDYGKHLKKPVRIINDAALQALGSYHGGRMLFLGLGTGLGSALVVNGLVVPLELSELKWGKHKKLEDRLGKTGFKRARARRWEAAVHSAVANLEAVFLPDYIVIGGGNVKTLKTLPEGVEAGHNRNVLRGGERLWQASVTPARSGKYGASIIWQPPVLA